MKVKARLQLTGSRGSLKSSDGSLDATFNTTSKFLSAVGITRSTDVTVDVKKGRQRGQWKITVDGV